MEIFWPVHKKAAEIQSHAAKFFSKNLDPVLKKTAVFLVLTCLSTSQVMPRQRLLTNLFARALALGPHPQRFRPDHYFLSNSESLRPFAQQIKRSGRIS